MCIFAEVPRAMPATRKEVVLINEESRYKGPLIKVHPKTGLPPAHSKSILPYAEWLHSHRRSRFFHRARGEFRYTVATIKHNYEVNKMFEEEIRKRQESQQEMDNDFMVELFRRSFVGQPQPWEFGF